MKPAGARAAAVLVGLGLALLATLARAAEPFDVYLLAVGSSHYAEARGEGLAPFGPIPGANKSARLVAELFARRGATTATVLTSAPDRFVTRADIDEALDGLEARIAEDRPARPLLVFYFAGHGVGEGVGWNHFAVPGEIVPRGDPQRLSLDALAGAAVHAATLVDRLQRAGRPFVVLLDTCYEGQPATFVNGVLSAQTSGAIADIAEGLRRLNRFAGPDPVLFSAEPGQVVATVPDPLDADAERVAPMARRLLRLDTAAADGLSLAELVTGLRRGDLDAVTAAPVTHAVRGPGWDRRVWSRPGPGAEPERRRGSGLTARICCDPPPAAAQQPLAGEIEVAGPAGEFVSDGRTWRLRRGIVAVEPNERGAIRLHVDGEAAHWSVALEAAQGDPLRIGRYAGAGRWPAEDGRPGFSVSGDGRGCNTSRGEFTIEALRWETPNRLAEVAFTGRQYCDDIPVPLTVRGRLKAVR